MAGAVGGQPAGLVQGPGGGDQGRGQIRGQVRLLTNQRRVL